jgi:site-specific DNA-methyltransferase (adenine-specific)
VRFYATSTKGRFTGWVSLAEVTANHDAVDTYKALIPKAGSDGGQKLPDVVLGKPWVADRPSVCTQSFLFVATKTKKEAESVASYYRTRFVRFLVSLRKIAQDTTATSYLWCPQQTWDRTWTDKELYAKYGITKTEQTYIESQVREMNLDDTDDE